MKVSPTLKPAPVASEVAVGTNTPAVVTVGVAPNSEADCASVPREKVPPSAVPVKAMKLPLAAAVTEEPAALSWVLIALMKAV